VAKIALKSSLKGFQGSWISDLNLLLPIAAIGTTLLMTRFLFVVLRQSAAHGRPHFSMWLSWTFTVLLTVSAVWLLPVARKAVAMSLQTASLWQALWPIAAGVLLSGSVWLMAVRKNWRPVPCIPEGDLLFIIIYFHRQILHFGSLQLKLIQRIILPALKGLQMKRLRLEGIHKLPVRIENWLVNWQTAGLLFVTLIGFLFAWSLS
jgi:hypothetical protein